ncbi:MAG TPA: hypothetical protein VLI67_01205 [Vicinamibacteria bacterium]|nr:hypothetical protein [Vicinamibacteria bacterium]
MTDRPQRLLALVGRPADPASSVGGAEAESSAAAAHGNEAAPVLPEDADRPLKGWERYRALMHALEEGHDREDLADHKARFALVIVGALNAILFVLGRDHGLEAVPPGLSRAFLVYLSVYVLVVLYCLLQAIESLRPRGGGLPGGAPAPPGVRDGQDVVRRDAEAHRLAWREIRLAALIDELARQGHALSISNEAKEAALRRLFLGLRVMTLLATGLLGLAAAFALGR